MDSLQRPDYIIIFVTRVAIDADALHIERSQEIKNIEIAVSISQVADLIDTSSP